MGVDWPEEVARLENELDGEIVVYGSRRLSHALIGWAWWTSCALVYPVVLGARRSAVRRGAGQGRAAPGRIASVRRRRGEHDLCTCLGKRVMRTLGISLRQGWHLDAGRQ